MLKIENQPGKKLAYSGSTSETRLAYCLHGAISQMMLTSIATAVSTSNPIKCLFVTEYVTGLQEQTEFKATTAET
jgi:hypothetical protein